MDTKQAVTKEEIREALDAWHSTEQAALLEQLRLIQEGRKSAESTNDPIAYRAITNQVLLKAIETLAQSKPHLAKLIEVRFLNNEVEGEAAAQLGVSLPTFYRHRRKALDLLCGIINAWENRLQIRHTQSLREQLPTPLADQLFGSNNNVAVLCTLLSETNNPYQQLLVSGIGGIGKTTTLIRTLDKLAEKSPYEHFIWVEIDYDPLDPFATEQDCWQQILTTVRRYLGNIGVSAQSEEQIKLWFRRNIALLVIDNLERAEDTNYLLQKLRNWTQPSRVIMASRALATQHPHVFTSPVAELSATDSIALIRHLAITTQQHALATAEDRILCQIYQHAGGNPLAIRLILGLTQTLPLAAALNDLPKAQFVATEELYKRIYWQVWHHLTVSAQSLFKAMALISSSGSEAELIQATTGQENAVFWSAIAELSSRSLLIQKGDTLNPRYAIHRISDMFLQGEVIKWQSIANSADLSKPT